MFYKTPDVREYVKTVNKYRIAIIALYLILFTTTLFIFKPVFVSSEELFWLSESQAYEKTKSKEFTTNYLSRLTLYIDHFDQKALDSLIDFEKELNDLERVIYVDSLLSSKKIYNDSDGLGSSLVKTQGLASLSAEQIKTIVSLFPQKYAHYSEKDLTHIHLYINAKESINLDEMSIPFTYEYSHPNDRASQNDYLIYILSIVLSIVLLFRYLFKNFFSSMIAILIIMITLVSTMALTALVTGFSAFYLSMALIVIAVSLVDYLYFYYRWHVSQYQADIGRAMCKTLNRNISPAFWTSFITILGLGTLVFVDSIVIQHLSISVIAASTITYVLNLTLLPALLSYFEVKHPRIGFARLGYTFAKLELHYNHKFFSLFMVASFFLMIVGLYQLTSSSQTLFENSEKSGVITAKLPLYELDFPLIKRIDAFESSLKQKFSSSVKVHSAASQIHALHQANYKGVVLDEELFLEAKMYLELYGLDWGLVDKDSFKVTITFNPENRSKTELLHWIEKQDIVDLYITDVDSLMSHAKSQATVVLAASVATALLIIGLIMGRLFRSKEMILIAFAVNILPMVWFGLIVFLLGLPLSIEALIAVTMALALGSDASVHFAYKYFRSRFIGRSLKHSLEKMFFYAAIPMSIGSLILSSVFISLIFTSVYSLELIGMYGAILMALSLMTDLFILPVMLIAFDKYFTQRGDAEILYTAGDSCAV